MTETNQDTPPPRQGEEISEDEKILAAMAYVPVVCLIPLLQRERSAFVAGHARLGFTLFLVELLALLLRLRLIWDAVIFLCVCLALIGIFRVLRGKDYILPFLSDLFRRHW
jgi:uncharacterized membrane protein